MPPDTEGQWQGIRQTPGDSRTAGDARGVFVVHASLLKNGKVLWWSGHTESAHYLSESYEWDPLTDPSTATRVPFPSGVDIFCCHHANLEDGRILALGGSRAHPAHGSGIRDICVYDPDAPAANRWRKIGEMNEARWYPTLVALPDGSFVVFSGRDHTGHAIAQTVELLRPPFQGPGYTTQTLSGADKRFPTYPSLHLVRGGALVHSSTTWRYELGAETPIGTFSLHRTGPTSAVWTDEGIFPHIRNREEGMAVLLPPAQDGKILLVGGGRAQITATGAFTGHEPSSNLRAAEVLDTRARPMAWRRLADMHHPRVNVSAVLLADGKVLVQGGHDSFKWSGSQVPSNRAEIYDPVLDTWTEAATMGARRTYHSASLLLPDGSVVIAGGVDPTQSETFTDADGMIASGPLNQKTYEIYRPPYFFNGARPRILNVTRDDGPAGELAYGGLFRIETDVTAATIAKVVLTRPGSMTHHTDSEQRWVPLEFLPSAARVVTAGVLSDPSVAPPGPYLLWVIDNQGRPCEQARLLQLTRKSCWILTDRSHISRDEVADSGDTNVGDVFYVVMEGFLHTELGITLPLPGPGMALDALAPVVTLHPDGGAAVSSVVALPVEVKAEVPALPAGVRQRFVFRYQLRFSGSGVFFDGAGTAIESRQLEVRASRGGYSCRGQLTLTHQPNPFMLDGDPFWLSTDVRVFQVAETGGRLGQTLGSGELATAYLERVLNHLNGGNGGLFDSDLGTDSEAGRLELETSVAGRRVYNFAIAKVRYRGRMLSATDVRVFFRLFMTATPDTTYQLDTYRKELRRLPDGTVAPGDIPVPMLGLRGGELVTVPFFAAPRVNTSLQSLAVQNDDPLNRKTLTPLAAGETEKAVFFGCWLDINQTALRFPVAPPNATGPFSSGLVPIRGLIRGPHQCLVAELSFAADPIAAGLTPATSDNLSQRNLILVSSDNPGSPATHTVQHTLEIRASQQMDVEDPAQMAYFTVLRPAGLALTHGPDTQPGQPAGRGAHLLRIAPDELMIDWGNLPSGTTATLYAPQLDARAMAQVAWLRSGLHTITAVDDHTVRLVAEGVSFLPLPAARTEKVAALVSIELPATVTVRERFRLSLHQLDGLRQRLVGAVEWVIPVSKAELLLADEERTLSVFRHIAQFIPENDRWYPIFQRYLGHLADRVRGFGGDPDGRQEGGTPGEGTTPAEAEWRRRCCTLQRWMLALSALLALLFGLALLVPGARRFLLIAAGLVLLALAVLGILLVSHKCLCCDGKDGSGGD